MKEVLKKIDMTKEELREEIFDTKEELREELKEEIFNTKEELRKELKEEIFNTKEELREELKEEIFNTKEELRKEFKQEIQYLKLDLKQKYDDLREAIFYLETNLGGKMDTICDFIKMQTEKNTESSENFYQVHKKIEKNELKILNHDDRIKFLEKKLNQAN